MSVIIKTPEQIEKCASLAAWPGMSDHDRPHVKEGVTTGELDRLCHDYIINVQKAIPAPP